MPASRGGTSGGAQKTFGLTSSRGSFKKRGGGAGRNYRSKASTSAAASLISASEASTTNEDRFAAAASRDEIDTRLGFERLEPGPNRQAWLVNMHPTIIPDPDGLNSVGKSAVDFYFIEDDSSSFKITLQFQPYFLIACRPGTESSVEEWLNRNYESTLSSVKRERKEDLKLPNHLIGHSRIYLRLSFSNVHDLLDVRKELLPLAQKSIKQRDAIDTYADVLTASSNLEGIESSGGDAAMEIGFDDDLMNPDWTRDQDGDGWNGNMGKGKKRKGAGFTGAGGTRLKNLDPEECIVDIREYDVPYYLRAAIDNHIRVGLWYDVIFSEGTISLKSVPERVKRAEPVVLAFDIETTKQPLKFPDAQTDCVMMISYMVDGQGFLITNREIVSEDIDDFEYTPRDEYEGPFIIFNEPDELSLLHRFFSHFREVRPTVVATYNGDSFDFPFLDARATAHGLNMGYEIGFSIDAESEYKSQASAHMDCFRWVKRDSYLPQGSQGLKAVTVAKLGYDPMELDPEVMTPYAIEQPQTLAQYSVSDAVATYYLYMKYVHPFIFSLCNIIPLNPDEVLRKGSGTLCETLLMVEAYKGNIVMPNRHVDPIGNMYDGHLLESETYVGGHVEALEAGVFRSDIPTNFKVDPTAAQELIDQLDAALKFSIVEEGKMALDDITNYEEVRDEIKSMLELMRDEPLRMDKPLIYHLDVAAMYPNIMLSNRLQPDSVVDEATCATCDYNRPGMQCNKKMDWAWRGEFFPAKRDEIAMIKHALSSETFPSRNPGGNRRPFEDLSIAEQTAILHKRLGDYSRKVYKKTHETKTVVRQATICQRENPFYIDTVRDFRDRRYEYKGLHKTWKKNLDTATSSSESTLGEIAEAKKMIVLYDSLQLAHKCILNSFYGYVMRKGARWYSMEMAGITCLTGAKIIQMARELVERIGRPLELDTDGIWCMLPGVFPENFDFKTASGKKFGISYPCTMLNHLVHEVFTNHQYHDLVDSKTGHYEIHSENSIFFELDGPYRAMILPSSKEEDRLLKKRYAVFEHDGSLAELKGFEVKRRGELQLIKDFQKQIFEKFLLGDNLVECYAAVAKVADQWLDVLYSRGSTLHDQELIDLIAENKSMSKTLLEYGTQKSAAITTAKRLAEFLGAQMVKDKGLACKFIISAKPHGAPVTERAVPVAIFGAEPDIKAHYLRRFLKDPGLTNFDLRSILDWEYYIDRFGGVIQKLITIPAAMQKVPNPVPRVRHPDWLFKRIARKEDKFKQRKLTDAFKPGQRFGPMKSKAIGGDDDEEGEMDIEEIGSEGAKASKAKKANAKAGPQPEVPLPDIADDYRGWVSVMKKRWAKRRHERKQELKALGLTSKTAASSARAAPSAGTGRMAELISRRSMGMATANWEVIQICASARPGEFRLWVLVDSQLQSLKLRVPRQFYINFKSLPAAGTFIEGYTVESLVRTLPRGTPCRHLFRITVSEDIYLEEEGHFSTLLNQPNVEGVYEMQVPLDIRALIQLGSACSLTGGTVSKLSKGLDSGFELNDLGKANAASFGLQKPVYLKGGNLIRYFYLYHASRDGRHVFGLFSPEGEAKVHVVDSAGLRQLPNLDTMYADRVSNLKKLGKVVDGEGVFSYPDSVKFNLQVHRNDGRALKAIAKELTAMRTARQGSAMLVTCSSHSQAYYEERIGSAVTEFPILSIPASPAEDNLPPLGWQLYSARRMFGAYLRTSAWIANWIKLAAHIDVPLCNIGRDFSAFGADIDFARRLIQNDMVLWWSQSTQPDLGGREEDTNGAAGAWGEETDNDGGLELSNPGCYSNVTFEVSLRDLAIDAVMQSGTVNDIEGAGGGSMAFDSASHNLDEYAKGTAHTDAVLGDSVLTSQVFLAVKAMARSWFVSKVKGRSQYSTLLADNFWRWASSTTSAMYEPALQRFLNGLMRKTLLQLLAEFKRLGVNIVYASYSRIFLLTTKPTAGSAAAYGRYLMSAVTSRTLFKHLSLEIVHSWEYLLWMDVANFGGVICADPEQTQLHEEIDQEEGWEVDMNWNVARFLPPAVQERFSKVVGNFIIALYAAKKKTSAALEKTPMRIVHRSLTQGGEEEEEEGPDVGGVEETLKEKEIKHAQGLVRHQTTRRILRSVSEINSISSEVAIDPDADPDLIESWTFPLQPGAYLQPKGPALEFIKTVCAVLGLAKELSAEVGVCRRNALELIGVREFAPEAEWRNPCAPFRVGRLICLFCNEERTLDLARDPDLMPSVPGEAREWKCSRCQYEYDRSAIEARLVSRAHSHLTAYAQQDLRCNRCGGVRPNNVAAHCDCSGSWGTTITRRETLRRLRLMQTVAKYHAMEILEGAVDGLLSIV